MLVIPFADGIGDFVMLLPLLRHIRQRFPDAALTVAASERSALLVDEGDDALTVRTPSWLRERPRPRGGPLRRLVPQAVLASVAGMALRVELGSYERTLNLFHWWERGVDFGRYWTPQVPERPGAAHTLDILAGRLGEELGTPLSHALRIPRVSVRPSAATWAAQWWVEAGYAETPVVALVPESNMAIKRWPLHSWARLADGLAAAGCRTVLMLPPAPPAEPGALTLDGSSGLLDGSASLGSPSDQTPATTATLNRLTRCAPDVVRAPLDRVAAVLARCSLVVGVDTGLLHLAAAVGTRYVGLFGPTNPRVTGPYEAGLGTCLVAPFAKTSACAGCWRQFKYIDDRCAALGTPSCMGVLSPKAVLAASLAELERVARRGEAAAEDSALVAV